MHPKQSPTSSTSFQINLLFLKMYNSNPQEKGHHQHIHCQPTLQFESRRSIAVSLTIGIEQVFANVFQNRRFNVNDDLRKVVLDFGSPSGLVVEDGLEDGRHVCVLAFDEELVAVF